MKEKDKKWEPICCRDGNPGIGWFSGYHPQCCGSCWPGPSGPVSDPVIKINKKEEEEK
ncbi:MAG: hypothetical protein HQP61_01965 [Peptococcaceae bacterium]|nr:hypothetical protein [Candidatus Syntrophopropionicum ammoniitolerans]